jgi:DNA modification methylase
MKNKTPIQKTIKQVKITPVIGRAMLQWLGKAPIDIVQSYPAQLVEQNGGTPLINIEYTSNIKDWQNLIFHGDNKEILSTLIAEGYRGKIDLIYIDPPFDSKADYIRKVELRGAKVNLDGEGQSVIEQTQYTDIWAGDSYLQFMYERLILMKELLSDQGSIYLHCDWHKSHHLRFLLDEVFGSDNFVNEIIWRYGKMSNMTDSFASNHDNIFVYRKNKLGFIFNKISSAESEYKIRFSKYVIDNKIKFGDVKNKTDNLINLRIKNIEKKLNRKIEDEDILFDFNNESKAQDDVFYDLSIVKGNSEEKLDYPTQKPESLLDRLITASTNPDSIVLDCFMGSGTTMAVAQKLGRRWIGCDINKGSIQTVAKRISKIIKSKIEKKYPNFAHYRINNYDLSVQHNEFSNIIKSKLGVEKITSEIFFDGKIGDKLVKFVEFTRMVTLADVELVKFELESRKGESRDIIIAGLGVDIQVRDFLIEYNKLRPINKIEVKDLKNDGLFVNKPAFADVEMKDGVLKIKNFVSPTIMERLKIDTDLFSEQVTDFRAVIDYVLIDTNYDGNAFNVCISDIPDKKKDIIKGEYQLKANHRAKVLLKIVDMLGEELILSF